MNCAYRCCALRDSRRRKLILAACDMFCLNAVLRFFAFDDHNFGGLESNLYAFLGMCLDILCGIYLLFCDEGRTDLCARLDVFNLGHLVNVLMRCCPSFNNVSVVSCFRYLLLCSWFRSDRSKVRLPDWTQRVGNAQASRILQKWCRSSIFRLDESGEISQRPCVYHGVNPPLIR